MKLTDKLGLKKPDLTDYVNISDLNDNMDVLDEEVGDLKEGSTVIEELETTNKSLVGAINEIDGEVKSHKAENATQTEYGHIRLSDIPKPKIDNMEDMRLNSNKELEYFNGVKWVYIDWKKGDDQIGAPGNKNLITGTMLEGFFGEVSVSDLVRGDDLAGMVGITAGSVDAPNEPWLKFAIDNKIIFIAKKSYRHNLSWNNLNSANVIYGETIVNIGGLQYKVRLMKGSNKNPTSTSSSDLSNSEWNRLFPKVAEGGIWKHNLGSRADGTYSAAELGYAARGAQAPASGYTLCQETIDGDSTNILTRGSGAVTRAVAFPKSDVRSDFIWRPVLEVVS